MKKRIVSALMVFVLLSSVLIGCQDHSGPDTHSPEKQNDAPVPTAVIQPLLVSRRAIPMKAVDGVEPYGSYWCDMNQSGFAPATITADLSNAAGLAYSIDIGNKTTFTKQLPAGYDPQALIEWGKYPGLNVDLLHKYGFTGKGAVIAYIDQPVMPHEQYDGSNFYITNTGEQEVSMHGPAVLSLLAGKEIGIAPDAEIYYYGFDPDADAQAHEADCLYQVIEQNKSLPESRKIRMVGFSDNIDESEAHVEEFREAVNACEEAGIMVWFCGENGAAFFLPNADRNNYNSLLPVHWQTSNPELVWVPAAGRTTASPMAQTDYIYWGANAGLSWTMPYTLGLYAIAVEIDPSLTQDALRSMIVDTAYVNSAGKKIVNPVGFVAAALEGVGRGEEAQTMLDEVKARTNYLYTAMDTKAMARSDYIAAADYLAGITDATVLVVDTAGLADVQDLRAAADQDVKQRGGHIASICIIGSANTAQALQSRYGLSLTVVPDGKDGLLYAVLDGYEEILPNQAAAALCESSGAVR